MDSLLKSALETVSSAVGLGSPETGSEMPLPEMSDSVHLPPPSQAMKETRAKLADINKKGLANLKKQLKDANAEVAAEEAVIAEADYDIEAELANGATRESLVARKTAAGVAAEILEVKLNEVESIKAKLEVKHKELNRRSHRLMSWLQQTEIATRAYQISMITGSDKLHPEKFARAYRLLESLEVYATEMLGEDLAKRVVASITHNPVEPTLHACLLAQMHPRDRKAIESELENNTTKKTKSTQGAK